MIIGVKVETFRPEAFRGMTTITTHKLKHLAAPLLQLGP